jgi:hypothetical protein
MTLLWVLLATNIALVGLWAYEIHLQKKLQKRIDADILIVEKLVATAREFQQLTAADLRQIDQLLHQGQPAKGQA